MTDELDAALRAMLDERSDAIPLVADPPGEIVGRARRRRSVKLGVLSGGGVAALVLIVGIVLVASDDSDSIDLVPATAGVSETTVWFDRLTPGSIVAFGGDGSVVELDAQGREVRQLAKVSSTCCGQPMVVGDVLVNADGAQVRALAWSGDDVDVESRLPPCTHEVTIDLRSGGWGIGAGPVRSQAARADGRLTAVIAAGDPDSFVCDPLDAQPSAVYVGMDTHDGRYEYQFGHTESPELALSDVALDPDGTQLAIEMCGPDGCEVRTVSLATQCFERACDYETESWEEMNALATCEDGETYDPVFAGGELFVTERGCADRQQLVAYEPDGARIATIRDLPDGWVTMAIWGDGVLGRAGADGFWLLTRDDSTRLPGEWQVITFVPGIADRAMAAPTGAVPTAGSAG